MYLEQEEKEREIAQAKTELTKLEAIKVLLSNNWLGCEVNVAGLIIGVSENSRLIPVIEAEMAEIAKYLNGEPNTWE
jgi:hypothetical protein